MKWSTSKLNALIRESEDNVRKGLRYNVSLEALRECRIEPTRIKPRAKPRRGPLRDPKYREFCRDQFCVIASASGMDLECDGPIDPSHTQNNGLSSKGPDSSCVPLCRYHHAEYDSGRAAFEKKYGVNLREIAKEHYERFQKEQEKG
jgi:hypothetical protein